MPIIYSYPVVSAVNNTDTLILSVSDSAADNGFITRSVTASTLSTFVRSDVNLNFFSDGLQSGSVNLSTQFFDVRGSSTTGVVTSANQGNILRIRLADNINIPNNITAGTNLLVGNDVQVDNDVNVDGETQTNTLVVTNAAQIQGSLSMTLNSINNVANPVFQQDAATKSYVDTLVSGGLNFRGSFRADTGEILSGMNTGSYLYNCPGGAGTRVATMVGDYYIVANAGGQFYCSGDLLNVGDSIIAVVDAAADSSTVNDWSTLESDNVEGAGVANTVPLWTDSQVLGDSNITQTGGGSIVISENLLVDQKEIEAKTLVINDTALISDKLTMEDDIDMTGNGNITNLLDPVGAQDAATKFYVDSNVSGSIGGSGSFRQVPIFTPNGTTIGDSIMRQFVNLGFPSKIQVGGDFEVIGDTALADVFLTGDINANSNKVENLGTPTAINDATTKVYVDTEITNTALILQNGIDSKVAKSGDFMTGQLDMGNNKISNLATPNSNSDAATKFYVDNQPGAGVTFDYTDLNTNLILGEAITFAAGGVGNVGLGNLIFTSVPSNTTFNTAVGDGAFQYSTSGGGNTAVGYNALKGDPTSPGSNFDNTAIGTQALEAIAGGDNNTAVGLEAGLSITTGRRNVFIGSRATKSSASANVTDNVVIGQSAGAQILGDQNTIVGKSANSFFGASGTNNIVIGYRANPSSLTADNEITFGDNNINALRIPGLQSGAADGSVLTYSTSTGVITLQPNPTGNVTSTTNSVNQIPIFTAANTINSSNEFTLDPLGAAKVGPGVLQGPSLGIGLNGSANSRGAVEVETFINYNGAPFNFFIPNNTTPTGYPVGVFDYFTGTDLFAISYWGVGRFMGSGIHIFSDERIKKDISVSDSAEDLEIISKIEISDYTHIDPIKGGKEKKVIAQQVKEHYPAAVKEGTDCVPDVFKQGKIKDGVIDFVFECEVGDKIKIMHNKASHKVVEVLEIKQDGIKVDSKVEGDVFVYGKEVDDYQTVDYDALSMLNISATQELYKIIKELKEEIQVLKGNS